MSYIYGFFFYNFQAEGFKTPNVLLSTDNSKTLSKKMVITQGYKTLLEEKNKRQTFIQREGLSALQSLF